MSRPLKFRAWDRREKRWVQAFTVFKAGSIKAGGKPKTYAAGNKRFVIEQATGLKDQAGKDIYEGDIVGGSGLGVVTYDLKHLTCGFVIERSGGMVPMPLGIPHHSVIRVLGNVHENPELLP